MYGVHCSPDTFLGFRVAKSLMMSLKSNSRSISDSMLLIARFTSRFCSMDVRNRSSINIDSPLQFDTIKIRRNIRRAVSMFGILACTPLSMISLYMKSLVLISSGSSSVKILANVTNWQFINKFNVQDLTSCSAAAWSSSEDSSFRWLKKLNWLDISLCSCRRWSTEAINWSITGKKLFVLYFSEGLSCTSSAWP